jgi:hypothetical protein
MITEDPFYDEDGVMIDEDGEGDWVDVDTAPLGKIVDGWVRDTVAKKPQEEYSPYITSNS